MSISVVAIGDIVADIVFTIPRLPVEAGRHQRAQEVTIEPGGAGNFLIAGARLGMKMHVLGVIGADGFGKAVLDGLQGEGVDTSGLVQRGEGATTPVLVLIDQSGQHVFVGGQRRGESVIASEEWHSLVCSADALFFNGFALIEPQVCDATLALAQAAQTKGTPVYFDPGPMFGEATLARRRAALRNASALLLTEDELALLTGSRQLESAEQLLHGRTAMVCIKRGGQGCRILTAHNVVEHPGFAVAVRDTTAAGDSFAAAFIYGHRAGWPLIQVAAFANAMGAAKVQKIGSGRQVPTAEEVRAVLHQFRASAPF
jgi:sugar/nucleoside kinase (ribokinase family)